MNKSCSVDGCIKKYYAKGFCKTHWRALRRNGYPGNQHGPEKCIVPGCEVKLGPRSKIGLCPFHYQRKRAGIPLDLNPSEKNKGNRNGNWKGGIFEYPNHYQMKKVRKYILEKSGYKCMHCGDKARIAHHLDKSKDNHDPSNFISVCTRCHVNIYHKKVNKPKQLILIHKKRGRPRKKEVINEELQYLDKLSRHFLVNLNMLG